MGNNTKNRPSTKLEAQGSKPRVERAPEGERKERLLSYSDCEAKHSGDGEILLVDDDAQLSATFISEMRDEFKVYLLFWERKEDVFAVLPTCFGKKLNLPNLFSGKKCDGLCCSSRNCRRPASEYSRGASQKQ